MNKKVSRNIYSILANTALFWVFIDMLPNAVLRLGSLSKLLAGLGFTVALAVGDFFIYFFKLPKVWVSYLIARLAIVFAYLWALDNYVANILDLGPSYLGGLDAVFFKIPKLLTLPDIYLTLGFSAAFLVICSIILEKLKK